MDNSFCYQIRLGNGDFWIFIKYFEKGRYDQYREIPKEFIDPEIKAATVKTNCTTVLPEEMED